jgi:luciferase family oxidoreductase group 1
MLLSVLDQSPVPAGSSPAQALANTVELARRCEALGYHRYWLAEHHGMSALAGSAPEILIGHVAAATSTIRVGSGGVMLSHYAPLKVAEQFRMLAALHPGRIDLGIGRAPGSDQRTAAALRTGPPDSQDRFGRQVAEVVGFLHDALHPEHPHASLRVTPAHDGAPDVWLLGSTDYSATLAAVMGLPFCFAHFIQPSGGPAVAAHYRDNFRPGVFLDEPVVAVAASVVCADTAAEAERLAASLRLWRLRLYRHGDPGPIPTPEEALAHEYTTAETSMLQLQGGRLIAGDPATCRAELEQLSRAYDADEAVVVTIVHDHAARVRSYELLADAFDLRPATSAPEPAPAEPAPPAHDHG